MLVPLDPPIVSQLRTIMKSDHLLWYFVYWSNKKTYVMSRLA